MCVCILPFIVYGSNINHDSTSAQRNMPPTSCPPRDPIGVAVRREVRVHFAVVLDAKLSTVEGWLASLANMTAMVNNKMVFDEVSTWRESKFKLALWASWVLPACHEGTWWTRLQFSKHKAYHLPLQAPSVLWTTPYPPRSSCQQSRALGFIFQIQLHICSGDVHEFTHPYRLFHMTVLTTWFDQSLLELFQLMGAIWAVCSVARKKKVEDFSKARKL